MFACIQGRSVSKLLVQDDLDSSLLVDLAFTFSPLVEQTTADTVVFDIGAGSVVWRGETYEIDASHDAMASAKNQANEIVRRAQELNLAINVSVARIRMRQSMRPGLSTARQLSILATRVCVWERFQLAD